MLLTDPEVENSLLISTDEGATYQKYRLSFYVLSLLFHPEQEDWILAYSHDQKVCQPFKAGIWVLCLVTLSYQRTQGCHHALHQCYINS